MKNGDRARKQRPLSRTAKVVSLATGLVLAWQIAAISVAAGHGDSDQDLAAADFAGASQAAAIAAAQQRLADNDFVGAKVISDRTLASSPISAATVRNLALAEQGLGNSQQANALFSQNAALGWRDAPTQLLLAQAFAQQKDYEAAAQRIDAALRVNPQAAGLYDALDQLAVDPLLARAVAQRLELQPGWRPYYFGHVDQLSGDALLTRTRLLILLSASPTPPARTEVIPILYNLIHDGRTALARSLWLRSQHIAAGAIADPGFAQIGNRGMAPFEWTLLPVPGATVAEDLQGSNAALQMSTDGTASGTLLRQAIALSAGPHELGYVGTVPLVARTAFGWSVRCMRNGRTLVNTIRSPAPPPYRFIVPDDCSGQWIELLVSSSAAAASRTVRFQRLEIH